MCAPAQTFSLEAFIQHYCSTPHSGSVFVPLTSSDELIFLRSDAYGPAKFFETSDEHSQDQFEKLFAQRVGYVPSGIKCLGSVPHCTSHEPTTVYLAYDCLPTHAGSAFTTCISRIIIPSHFLSDSTSANALVLVQDYFKQFEE